MCRFSLRCCRRLTSLALLPAINERFGLSEQQLAQLHPNRKKYTLISP